MTSAEKAGRELLLNLHAYERTVNGYKYGWDLAQEKDKNGKFNNCYFEGDAKKIAKALTKFSEDAVNDPNVVRVSRDVYEELSGKSKSQAEREQKLRLELVDKVKTLEGELAIARDTICTECKPAKERVSELGYELDEARKENDSLRRRTLFPNAGKDTEIKTLRKAVENAEKEFRDMVPVLDKQQMIMSAIACKEEADKCKQALTKTDGK